MNKTNKEVDHEKESIKNLITVNDIENELGKFNNLTPKMSHNDVINFIISKAKKVQFKKILGIKNEDEKRVIVQRELIVITIDSLIKNAESLNVGLAQKHGVFYIYNGQYWKHYDEDKLKLFLGDFSKKIGVNKFTSNYYKFRDELFKQLSSMSLFNEKLDDQGVVKINLRNGTFEIYPKSQRLRSFLKDDFLTYQLPFSYDPNASFPMFNKYINEVLPKECLQKVLSEYLGYVFIKTSYLKLEKVAFLYGDGANGKSVMFEIINALLLNENVSNYSLQSLTDINGYSRAKIVDKLVNYSSEISSKIGATAIFKSLASGEPIEARNPYKEPFIAGNYAKLIFNANNLPQDIEQTEGYFRRFLIIPFEVTISKEKQDKELSKKIIEHELPGVFNWILEGLRRLIKYKKFSYCKEIENIESQFRFESDSVQMFLKEGSYTPDFENSLSLKDVHQRYKVFCIEDGYRPVSNKILKKRMSKIGYTFHKKSFGISVYIASSINQNNYSR